MSCHTIPDTMISLATRFYSLAITLPHGTACCYCLERTCQIKEQLMHLIFNYCLVLQTLGECQSEQSCLGETKTEIFCKGAKKNRDEICISYYSFLFSPLTIHGYKTCSPPPWIIYHFFPSSRKVSRRRAVGKSMGPYWYLFTYVIDGRGRDLVKGELFMQVILSLTGSDRKRGASSASLAQREMFALKAEHSGSPILHFSHTWWQIWKVDQSFSLIHLSTIGTVRDHEDVKDQFMLWLYIRITWTTSQTRWCSESPPRLMKLASRK